MKKKHPFTLIELVIALSLTGILLSFLWQGFFAGQHTLASLAKDKQRRMQEELFSLKCRQVLSSLAENKERCPLYLAPAPGAGRQMLVATYCHPHDIDESFSGDVTTAFYTDSKNTLCQAIWGKNQSVRILKLVHDVKKVTFSFFDPITRQWIESWDSKSSKAPLYVRATIDVNATSSTWAFTPSTTDKVLTLP